MKKTTLLAVLAFTGNVFAQSIGSTVPFYFAVPTSSMVALPATATSAPNLGAIKVEGAVTTKAGLRGFFYKDPHTLRIPGDLAGASATVIAGKRKARQFAAADLLKRGVIKTGDVILSFRPLWKGTVPYAHIQMGVSHAGLLYVENGVVRNLDMPLDEHHNGAGYSSSIDAPHYLGGDTYHIVRPKNLTAEQSKNLYAWIQTVKKNAPAFRARNQLKFNSNYNAPSHNNGDSMVTTMGKIILGQNPTSGLTMFCSEFTWAMQALASCTPQDIANETSADARCVRPLFSPLPMIGSDAKPGLTDGPYQVLDSLDELAVSQKQALAKLLFTQADISRLKGGHLAMAKDPKTAQLTAVLNQLYGARLAGAQAPAQTVGMVNSNAPKNYSPTAFLIDSMGEASTRAFDYVATIIFTK